MKRFIPFIAKDPTVAVIRLNGVIAASPRGGTLSDAALGPVIERAFARGKPAAVALVINSPGGSPAQSSLIAARIRRLAAEKQVPVHAFVEDVAASGGYWLACAGDDIWIDDSSIVGSIGVISAGFGLHEAIGRLGVERRVHTAGGRKGFLDPFRPEDPEDVARLRRVQDGIHDNFRAHVRGARGERLAGPDEELFSGDFWLAGEAKALGLIDGIGHLVPTMKRILGDEIGFSVARPKRGLLQRIGATGARGGLAADAAAAAVGTAEERALFARYGL